MTAAEREIAARRNLTIPPDLWRKIVKAAAKETYETGRLVSASEWVRQAIRERMERVGRKKAK